MFSSNQILKVSGSLTDTNQLSCALEFALNYSGNSKNMNKKEMDRGCKLLYQITRDGKYCIGWGFKSIPDGWNEYPFRFDIDIVSKIIHQHLDDFEIIEGGGDGSYEKGFIMKCIEKSMSSEKYGIKNPFYCIIYFEPYMCFYSK